MITLTCELPSSTLGHVPDLRSPHLTFNWHNEHGVRNAAIDRTAQVVRAERMMLDGPKAATRRAIAGSG